MFAEVIGARSARQDGLSHEIGLREPPSLGAHRASGAQSRMPSCRAKPGKSTASRPLGWDEASCAVSGKQFGVRALVEAICTYNTYVPNKTISVPDDVVPIIEGLRVPFSRWVTDQLRRHAAQSTRSFADQLLADAALAAAEGLPREDALAAGDRMGRSAPW